MSSSQNIPIGFEAARRAVELGRSAFFPNPNQDVPVAESAQIAADDLLPQFGYVGANYASCRILLLGINPGKGPRRERSAGDRIAMPALHEFVAKRTPGSFLAAQLAYKQVCQGWAVWGRQCNELLGSGGIGPDDVAFTNALPWRTESQSAFFKAVARQAALLYTRPVIHELHPSIIVAVGKKAAEILEYASLLSESVIVWNRAQALRPAVIAEREAASRKFATLLRAQHANAT